MSEAFVAAADPELEGFRCDECGQVFKMSGHLANHKKWKHGEGPPPRQTRSVGYGRGSLQGRIRDACLGAAAVAAITDPRLYIAVEGTVDQFAMSWARVADASPSAKRYIEAMLVGGVWIPAVMSTVVMFVAVLMATDRLPANLSGLGYYAISQMDQASVQKLVAMHQPPAPEQNGGGAASGSEEAGDQ